VSRIQVYFPLSPTLTLCLCDPIVYGALPNDGVVNDVQNVMFQNSLQLRESTRCVLSRSGDFTLASEILNAQPEFGGPNRLRSRVAGDLP